MTKIITCSELRYRTAGELHALLRALQIDLDGTAICSHERQMVLANLEIVRRACGPPHPAGEAGRDAVRPSKSPARNWRENPLFWAPNRSFWCAKV
jgi:hypothetical protein